MTITKRTSIIIGASILLGFILVYFLVSQVLMYNVLALERLEVQKEMIAVSNAIAFDIMTVERFASDWSAWNDTYEFVQNGDLGYVSNNLMDVTFSGQKINVMLFFDANNHLVYGKWYDWNSARTIQVPAATSALLTNDPRFFANKAPYESIEGLIALPEGTMIVVSQPVYDSELKKGPMGHLIVGRYLDEQEWKTISRVIRIPAKLIPATNNQSSSGLDVLNSSDSSDLNLELQPSDTTISGQVYLKDIFGQDRFLLQIVQPRTVYMEGRRTANIILLLQGLSWLLVGLIILYMIKKHVLNRLISTSDKIDAVSSLDQLPDFDDSGEDEISHLNRRLKEMFVDLKRSHDELQYVSSHDELTGVYNRGYYDRFLMAQAEGVEDSRGIIICDIDGLKLANDLGGPYAGDQILLQLSLVLKEVCGPDSLIARIGGDEFVAILESNDDNYLNEKCIQIQAAMQERGGNEGGLINLSVSCGYASNIKEIASIKEMVKTADHLMQREKLHRSLSGRSGVVNTLRGALEARDYITEGHAQRMRELAMRLAYGMGIEPQRIPDILLFAEFHDVGKIGIPDNLLFKPGPLDEEERQQMQKHCAIGHQIAETTPDLAPIADLILLHHEWWNGHGYPQGLAGDAIPVECRILAVVDAYDAMTNDRPYRAAMAAGEALEELKNCAGLQFDPVIVEKFINIITEEYLD